MSPGVVDLSPTESRMKQGWPAQVAILLSHIRKMLWDIVGVKIYSHFAVSPSSFSAATQSRSRHQRECPPVARGGEAGGSDHLLPVRVQQLKSNPPGRPPPDAWPIQ